MRCGTGQQLAAVAGNPALLAQLTAAFEALQLSNPRLAAQLLSLATQLGSQQRIGSAA
ncbi:hypothetical protein [Mycobacterium simiae]|uniref:hypothetical protein n=1 Tax=Mycobacterium simiae TaxID=1784 RepID=UPI00165F8CA3|nr:hypothetical protein [Mycobacterium simiae]